MQYGGSVAHHAQMGKKKGLGSVGEVWTSLVRHVTNVWIDPSRQRIINLFLGIYNPMTNPTPIFNMQDDTENLRDDEKVI